MHHLLNIVPSHIKSFLQSFLTGRKDSWNHVTWDLWNNYCHFSKQFLRCGVLFINQFVFEIAEEEEEEEEEEEKEEEEEDGQGYRPDVAFFSDVVQLIYQWSLLNCVLKHRQNGQWIFSVGNSFLLDNRSKQIMV
jgi:hypothetical protein